MKLTENTPTVEAHVVEPGAVVTGNITDCVSAGIIAPEGVDITGLLSANTSIQSSIVGRGAKVSGNITNCVAAGIVWEVTPRKKT